MYVSQISELDYGLEEISVWALESVGLNGEEASGSLGWSGDVGLGSCEVGLKKRGLGQIGFR